MNFYIERLNNELQNILNFWKKYTSLENGIATEVYNSGTVNKAAPIGSLFLAKVIYGISASCKHLQDSQYKFLADKAFDELITKLKNPVGGYYWAINNNGKVIHDEINVTYAQAFIMNGLIEYYELTGNDIVKEILNEQMNFIENTLKNPIDDSYTDGYNQNWKPVEKQSKSIGMHLHMLEAFIKASEVFGAKDHNDRIKNLLNLILIHFVNHKTFEITHQLDEKWKALPNENWIGHNMEASWIICKAARKIGDPDLIQQSKNIAIEVCNNSISFGFDSKYGGMFNRFDKKELIVTDKEWWPQAESVIALLNAYSITTDKKYLSYAIRLLEYIDNIFSDPIDGEWYDSVTREGLPYKEKPKVHFWKSLYHNVRYCIETSQYLQRLYVRASEKTQ
jgi:mannobiose 2-epimerase